MTEEKLRVTWLCGLTASNLDSDFDSKIFQMPINFHLPFLRDTYFDIWGPILNK